MLVIYGTIPLRASNHKSETADSAITINHELTQAIIIYNNYHYDIRNHEVYKAETEYYKVKYVINNDIK